MDRRRHQKCVQIFFRMERGAWHSNWRVIRCFQVNWLMGWHLFPSHLHVSQNKFEFKWKMVFVRRYYFNLERVFEIRGYESEHEVNWIYSFGLFCFFFAFLRSASSKSDGLEMAVNESQREFWLRSCCTIRMNNSQRSSHWSETQSICNWVNVITSNQFEFFTFLSNTPLWHSLHSINHSETW